MAENADFGFDEQIGFGPFTLFPGRRRLLKHGVPHKVGSRAMEILVVLVQRPGQLVTKEEIVARAWPSTYVDQDNLKVNMSSLRKALGDDSRMPSYIATVSGRGYRFVAPVDVSAGLEKTLTRKAGLSLPASLPVPSTPLIGRKDAVRAVGESLPRGGVTTVVGPGGIGKTRVAIAVAEAQRQLYPDGVCFVDLATILEPSLAVERVFDALGLATMGEVTVAALCNRLRGRIILILLDNCEHVVEAAARIAFEVTTQSEGIHVLATSREPLRVPGERLHWLGDIGTPPADPLTVEQALAFPAVELFVARAAASLGAYQLSEQDVPAIRQICSAVDGNPLAIELAASRTHSLGIQGLVPLLADRFALLANGPRTVHGRQRTLLATMNWSYRLLSPAHQALLARLAVFVGPFTMESAVEVGAFGTLARKDVVMGLSDLVANSLATQSGGEETSFKLLETTRVFAMDRLNERGETSACMRRLSRHILEKLAEAERQIATGRFETWLRQNRWVLDNLRNSLAFAASTPDAANDHVGLAVTALPILVRLSLLEECRRMIETVFVQARTSSATRRALTREARMKLLVTWAGALLYTRGPTMEVERLWRKAMTLADDLKNDTFRIRAHWGLAFCSIYLGRHDDALDHLRRHHAAATAAGDLVAQRDGVRTEAAVLHYVGQHARAQEALERLLLHNVPEELDSRLSRFQVDHRVAAHGTLAHILFVRGRPDSARRHALEAVRHAAEIGHAVSFGNALVLAVIPVALYRGDYDEAERRLIQLEQHVEKNGLFIWTALHRTNRAALRVSRAEAGSLDDLAEALDDLRRVRLGVRYPMYLGILAEGLGVAGRLDDGRAAVEMAIAWSALHNETWSMAELVRIRGKLFERGETPADHRAAIACYQESLAIAQAQDAAGWGLRTAAQLAALWHRSGNPEPARQLLAPRLNALTEGMGTRDVTSAMGVLQALQADRTLSRLNGDEPETPGPRPG